MPKSGFDVSGDIAKLERFAKRVQRGSIAEAKRAAQNALDKFNDNAPESSGALKSAGYVIAREANGSVSSGYDRSIIEAAAENAEIKSRDQTQDELTPPQRNASQGWAAVHIPLDYADIQRNGYHDTQRGVAIPPDPTFDIAVDEAAAAYQKDTQKMLDFELKKLEKEK